MTIDDLNALTTLTATDEVPVWDSEESGEPTKKITASNLAASVKSLASLPNTTEMNTAIQQSTANLIKIKTHSFTGITFAAGAAGSRGAQYNISFTSGTIIGLTIIRVEDSTTIIPSVVFFDPDNKIYLNVYRASGAATTNNRVDVRIAYI